MSDGDRTRDRLDHNQELYQLSYAHREETNLPGEGFRKRDGPQEPVSIGGGALLLDQIAPAEATITRPIATISSGTTP